MNSFSECFVNLMPKFHNLNMEIHRYGQIDVKIAGDVVRKYNVYAYMSMHYMCVHVYIMCICMQVYYQVCIFCIFVVRLPSLYHLHYSYMYPISLSQSSLFLLMQLSYSLSLFTHLSILCPFIIYLSLIPLLRL